MTDKLVSIRMPKGLIEELKALVEKNHYLDLSEELRSVIRRQARYYLEEPREENTQRKQELLKELKKVLEVDYE